jgi:hypothetical protein
VEETRHPRRTGREKVGERDRGWERERFFEPSGTCVDMVSQQRPTVERCSTAKHVIKQNDVRERAQITTTRPDQGNVMDAGCRGCNRRSCWLSWTANEALYTTATYHIGPPRARPKRQETAASGLPLNENESFKNWRAMQGFIYAMRRVAMISGASRLSLACKKPIVARDTAPSR